MSIDDTIRSFDLMAAACGMDRAEYERMLDMLEDPERCRLAMAALTGLAETAWEGPPKGDGNGGRDPAAHDPGTETRAHRAAGKRDGSRAESA